MVVAQSSEFTDYMIGAVDRALCEDNSHMIIVIPEDVRNQIGACYRPAHVARGATIEETLKKFKKRMGIRYKSIYTIDLAEPIQEQIEKAWEVFLEVTRKKGTR